MRRHAVALRWHGSLRAPRLGTGDNVLLGAQVIPRGGRTRWSGNGGRLRRTESGARGLLFCVSVCFPLCNFYNLLSLSVPSDG